MDTEPYATGVVAPVTSLAATLRTRPLDRFDLEGRYTDLRLGDDRGGYRLRETIPEILATWYFAPAFYVLGDLQLHRSRRRLPAFHDSRSSLSALRIVYEPGLDWHAYFGVRSGEVRPFDRAAGGRSTELYAKLTRRFGIGS